ncbi:MAG: winged helix-turn-helix domain-containing protein [Candidatus Woesearchaeota archaeon]
MNKEAAFILDPQRWNIITSITNQNTSATAIAKDVGLSTAYISTQLKLLEAYGYIRRLPPKKNHVGKPKHEYEIAKDTLIIAGIKHDDAKLNIITQHRKHTFIFNTAFFPNEDHIYHLQKFYYLHEDLITGLDLLAYLGHDKEGMHFLAVNDEVEDLRKHHSNITIKHPEGTEQRIIIWSHTPDEIITGLEAGEKYYTSKLKEAVAFWDKNGKTLDKLKKHLKEDDA